MKVYINDDFDIEKIVNSGQCFRPCKVRPGMYRFITGEHVLYITAAGAVTENGAGEYEINCSEDEWKYVWIPYFDLERNYSEIRKKIPKEDSFMQRAGKAGAGVRILKQEPFEMLISFIISQRKNIPAIRSCVEKICSIYGKETNVSYMDFEEKVHLFPKAWEIAKGEVGRLCECSLGYRLPYVEEASKNVAAGVLNMEAAGNLSDEELLNFLMSIKGVGIKVASCVALFAYGRGAIAPVDVWINRIIENEYGGVSPFPGYGDNSGIFQQYAFYMAVNPR